MNISTLSTLEMMFLLASVSVLFDQLSWSYAGMNGLSYCFSRKRSRQTLNEQHKER